MCKHLCGLYKILNVSQMRSLVAIQCWWDWWDNFIFHKAKSGPNVYTALHHRFKEALFHVGEWDNMYFRCIKTVFAPTNWQTHLILAIGNSFLPPV